MFKNFSYRLSAALMGTAIVVMQPQITVPQTLDEQAIASLARDATVVVNGQNPGSGVMAIPLESGDISLCNRVTGKELRILNGQYLPFLVLVRV